MTRVQRDKVPNMGHIFDSVDWTTYSSIAVPAPLMPIGIMHVHVTHGPGNCLMQAPSRDAVLIGEHARTHGQGWELCDRPPLDMLTLHPFMSYLGYGTMYLGINTVVNSKEIKK